MNYRVISLDTAANEPRPSDLERIMRELPTPKSEQGTVRRTSNGNLVTTTRR